MRTRFKGLEIEPFDLELESSIRMRAAEKKKLEFTMADNQPNPPNPDVVVEEIRRQFAELTAR